MEKIACFISFHDLTYLKILQSWDMDSEYIFMYFPFLKLIRLTKIV